MLRVWFVNLVLFCFFFLFFGVFRYVYLFIRVVCCFLCAGEVVLGGVGEVFVARIISGGKVTVPRRVRDVLNLESGDYVRVTVTEVIKRKRQERVGKAKGKR